ncbi:unnamed protein product, partial [Sphacelaria rigidula]
MATLVPHSSSNASSCPYCYAQRRGLHVNHHHCSAATTPTATPQQHEQWQRGVRLSMQLSTRGFATVPQHDDDNNNERGDNGTGRGKQRAPGVLGARAAKADGAEAAGA